MLEPVDKEGMVIEHRRHIGVFKEIIAPLMVIIVAMVIGAGVSTYIAVVVMQGEFADFESNQLKQAQISAKLEETQRRMEIDDAVWRERILIAGTDIAKLQKDTTDRFTGKDSEVALIPLVIRIDQLRETQMFIKERLFVLEKEVNNGN